MFYNNLTMAYTGRNMSWLEIIMALIIMFAYSNVIQYKYCSAIKEHYFHYTSAAVRVERESSTFKETR